MQWLKLPSWKVGDRSLEPRPGLQVSKKQMFIPHSFVKMPYCGEPPCPRGSVLGLRPPGLEFRIMCALSSHSSQHPQEVVLARFSLYVYEGGLIPHSLHFIW